MTAPHCRIKRFTIKPHIIPPFDGATIKVPANGGYFVRTGPNSWERIGVLLYVRLNR